MKKLLILLVSMSLFISCSKSDDSQVPLTPHELLVQGSPWIFSDIEALEVIYNPENLTIPEIEAIFRDGYQNFTYSFASDGTGVATLPDGTARSFNYSYDFNKITATGSVQGVLNSVVVSATSLQFTINEVCFDAGNNDDVCINGRFTYN